MSIVLHRIHFCSFYFVLERPSVCSSSRLSINSSDSGVDHRCLLGFGDLVPMQNSDYSTISWLYILFCLMYILTGLTVVASSGNLLILRFVETNSKRTQHERMEMEERRRQQVRIIGDVISSNGRLVTLEDDENDPSSVSYIGTQRITMNNTTPSDISLCSCRAQPSLSSCLPTSCKKKFKRKQQLVSNKNLPLATKCRSLAGQTLQQQILDALQTKTEVDEHTALQRSYLQLDRVQKRSSI